MSDALDQSNWHALFDRYYRKIPLYQMLWDTSKIEIENMKIVGAPFGGPLAVVRDAHAPVLRGDSEMCKIRIFTSAGSLLSSISWELGPIAGLGWNSSEQLVCVSDNGTVVLYDVHGVRCCSFNLPAPVRSNGVAECHFWPNGLVVRTGINSQLWAINNYHTQQVQQLANVTGLIGSPPTCMSVVDRGSDSGVEVLLATASGSVLCVDASSCTDQLIQAGPFERLSISPSGQLIAAFNTDGTLHLISTDFSSHLSKFTVGSKVPPNQLVWCGEEAVLLAWDGMLLLVGLLGDFVKFNMEEPFVCINELDGCRIITSTSCSWLSRVPDSTESIFKAGSNSAAARLFDAQEAFEKKSALADDNLRALIGSGQPDSIAALKTAIEQCLHAAAHEFDNDDQRSLLKAASYGKLVCPGFKADKFVEMCRILRVINALRHHSVGMPITYTQYVKLEGEVLVDRLVNRHKHFLAVRICSYLRIPPERVLVHWACEKIKSCEKIADEQLGDIIVKKLSSAPAISYAAIAETAFKHGRKPLATLLLEYEPLAANQVPLLMSMEQDELALNKAIQSGDTDLVYLALLHLQRHRKPNEFIALIKDKPLARDLYIAYCKTSDLPALKKFYIFLQKNCDAGDVCVMEAYECSRLDDRLQLLKVAQDYYEKDPNNTFAVRAVKEQIALLEIQLEQERTTGEPGYIDLSVTQLMEKAIMKGGESRNVSKWKSVLNVGSDRMWHIEVAALSKAGCWDELAKLVANKKQPPIGFQPFIEACIQYKNMPEAAKYIQRLPDYHEQMEWLCNIGYWREAVDIASREKDSEALLLLRARCRQAPVLQHIERLLQAMGGNSLSK